MRVNIDGKTPVSNMYKGVDMYICTHTHICMYYVMYMYYLVKCFLPKTYFFFCRNSEWLFRDYELKGKVTTKGWRSWNHFSYNSPRVGKFKEVH